MLELERECVLVMLASEVRGGFGGERELSRVRIELMQCVYIVHVGESRARKEKIAGEEKEKENVVVGVLWRLCGRRGDYNSEQKSSLSRFYFLLGGHQSCIY